MRNHPHQLGVQMAATACLYNLTKGDMGVRVHPRWLKEVVELTMIAMENFSNHQQVKRQSDMSVSCFNVINISV